MERMWGHGDSEDGDRNSPGPCRWRDVEHLRHGDMETVGVGTVGLWKGRR